MTALPIVAAALAPDASWAVTVADGGTVRAWVHGVADRHRESVRIAAGPTAVALSDNVLTVLCAADGLLRWYERTPDSRPGRDAFLRAPAPVRALALAPSGHAAAVAYHDGTLRGLDLRTGDSGWTVATGAVPVLAVAMAADGGPVVATFTDGSIRRYDLGTRASVTVGGGSPAHAVAITPDGEVVVTADAEGRLCRWNARTGAPPETRALDEAITAIAVDRTGERALAGTGDGRSWLYNLLTGGPGFEYVVPARTVLAYPAPGAQAPTAAPLPAHPRVIDEDVRFTVYRPQVLSPTRWASLLVFAHKTDSVAEPGRPALNPEEQVEARARAHFGGATPRPVGEDAKHGLARGAKLRIVPDLPGVQCNPRDAEVEWLEPVHEVMFRLLAGADLAGTVVRGAVRIWCGPLILGEVSVAVRVAADAPAEESPPAVASVLRYRKIFPSYSHQDRAVVQGFADAARALGDQYLQDVLSLRAGERWDARLLELIEDADVFQLFWSGNSMRSPHCQDEWEHALALRRPLFVRPLYWEDPLPTDLERGLPPAALRALHFVKVPVARPVLPGPPSGSPRDDGPPKAIRPGSQVYQGRTSLKRHAGRGAAARALVYLLLAAAAAVGFILIARAIAGR